MSATNAFETALLTLYFNNTDHANVGDAGCPVRCGVGPRVWSLC